MKCPKCGYVSHDYLDACRKCHKDLVMFKRELHLEVPQPGDLDLSELLGESWQSFGGRVKFSDDNSFFRDQRLGGLEGADDNGKGDFDIELDNRTSAPSWRSDMPSGSLEQASMTEAPGVDVEPDEIVVETEVDNPCDEDLPDTPGKETQRPGELTKMFYVPEDLDAPSAAQKPPGVDVEPDEIVVETEVDNPCDEDLPDTPGKETQRPGELTKMFYVPEDLDAPSAAQKPPGVDVEPDGPVQATGTEASAGNTPHTAIDGIDMDLDDALVALEDIELDTSELDQEVGIELDFPLDAEIEHVSDNGRSPTAISKASVSDETAEPMLTEAQDEPLVTETSEVTADLASNDLATDELVLEMEETDDDPAVSAGRRTTTS